MSTNLKYQLNNPVFYPFFKAYKQFLLQSPLDVSHSFEDSGNWREMVVRSNHVGDLMAIVSFVQNELSDMEKEDAILSLQDFFAYGEGKDCRLSSLYFQSRLVKAHD